MADKKATEKDAKPPDVFVPGDLLNPDTLLRRLQDDNAPLSRYFATRIRPETLRLVRDHDTSKPVAKQLKVALIEEFNRIVAGPLVYDAKAFRQVEVNEDTRRLLDTTRKGDDLARLNAMLIEDAFPTELLRNYTKWPKVPVERVQTGVRIEKRMLKVLKGMAEYQEMTLGELLEDIVLHAFGGVSKFDGKASQERIEALKKVYGMDYDAHAAYRFLEARSAG
jgi:hypothetical protein